MNEPSLPTSELLLQQVSWMRSLARQLVSDAHLADDLAQETLMKALESPPRDGERLRGWLQTVMRNLFREHVRQRESRQAREAAGAPGEALPGTEELVERVHTQRRVADSLLTLDEPYRTAVLLRYYEDLPPRAIAERQGVPVATVKSRLNRGLEKLRERLDAEYGGDRAAWAMALVPFARELAPPAAGSAAAASSSTGSAGAAKLALAAAAVLVGVGGWAIWRGDEGEARSAQSVGAAGLAASAGTDSTLASPTRPVIARDESAFGSEAQAQAARTPVETGAANGPAAAPTAAESHTVRGRVLDGDGQPVSGVQVVLRGTQDGALSAGGGAFEFETEKTLGKLDVSGSPWAPIRTGSWARDSGLDPVLVVGPALEVEGRVLNEWGRPLAGARVALVLPGDFETRFDQVLDASYQERWSEASESDGSFSLLGVPAVAGAELRVTHDRYDPVTQPAPLDSTTDLVIELRAPTIATGRALRGVVLRADGKPAADAHVALGFASVRADRAGQFALDLEIARRTETLFAVEAGQLPATLTRPAKPTETSTGWPDFIEVRLGGPALTVTGRVVDESGNPLAGGRVWVAKSTDFGIVGSFPIRLEPLMAGGKVPDAAIESLARADQPTDETLGSATPQFASDALLYWVVTDADGRFELPGLDDRKYVLNVLDEKLHWGTVSDPIQAGARDVELVVPSYAVFERVRGAVVTDRGDPVPGVKITPWIPAFEWRDQVRAGTADVMRFFLGQTVTTDAEGEFELLRVPRQHIQFHLVSDEITPSYTSVDAIEDPESFEIQVLARVHLEIELATASTADSFRAKDRDGNVLTLLEMRADGYSNYTTMPLVAGRSGVVTVTSDAATIELLKDGAVVETTAVTPRPGQPLRLQL